MSARRVPPAPWDDCKVAFGVEDEDAIPTRGARPRALRLPRGWELDSIVISGAAGYVVLFRVEGVPSAADGAAVAAALVRVGANPAAGPARLARVVRDGAEYATVDGAIRLFRIARGSAWKATRVAGPAGNTVAVCRTLRELRITLARDGEP
jgi:hypothetical protein